MIDVLARDDLVLDEHRRGRRDGGRGSRAPAGSARRHSARENTRPRRSSGVRGSRSSARASGSAFWPTIAQCSLRPLSWNARAAPSALGSLAAPTRMCLAFVSRRCLRTRSSAVLNWPSASIDTTGQAAASCITSRMPATTPAHSRRRQRARARDLEQQDFVGIAGPVLLRPARQVPPGEQPRFVVVRAEVGGARMRNVDGDHRDARLVIRRGDGRRDGFVGLELDDQIDTARESAVRRS